MNHGSYLPTAQNLFQRDLRLLKCILYANLYVQELENLRTHIAETYAHYVASRQFHIMINGITVTPLTFDQWAYPPTYGPKELSFELVNEEGERVRGTISAGLVREKRPGGDDYGVYFYCNNRLIAKEVKDKSVGYITSYAGIPHSDASLARVIVSLRGPAKAMPWNSTKSAIIFAHPTFRAFQNGLIQILTYYSKLSRGFRSQWDESVFAYKTGKIQRLKLKDVQRIKKAYLPPIPKAVKHRIDHLRDDNQQIVKDKPWTVGLVESIAAVDVIRRQKFQTKNRIALLLLDSSFEIALKEFIVHTDGLDLGGKTLAQLFQRRAAVVKIVEQRVSFDAATLEKINHYYRLRNQLIHERATATVTPEDIDNYQETVQGVLEQLFGLKF
jgi:hypothetical protein